MDTNEWQEAEFLQPMPLPPRQYFACTIYRKKLVINAGEWKKKTDVLSKLKTTNVFNFYQHGWDVGHQFELMNISRSHHTLHSLKDGRDEYLTAIAGGNTGYDQEHENPSQLNSVSVEIHHHGFKG